MGLCRPVRFPLTPTHEGMEADVMLDKGDLDGAAVWRRIVKAIGRLQRQELGPGERWY